jgi:hypothetical protein
MGKVGLAHLARAMDLLEDDLASRTGLRTPGGDMTLEGAELSRLVAVRMEQTQLGKQGFGLESTVTLELLNDPRPILGERVGAGAMGARLFELAGQLGSALVGASGTDTHAGTGGSLFLGFAFGAFASH